ncbi:MAG: AAA family ATPase [Methanobrevibacter sp.]|nr:AAA family ATPase [Methanobrevibacter sp.]
MFFNEDLNKYIQFKFVENEKKLEKIKGFNFKEEYFLIKNALDQYLDNQLENRFIALHGLRGVGKTTILYQLYNYLLNEKKIDSKNVLYVSMDQVNSFFDTDLYELVYTFIKGTHNKNIAFLDEKIFIFVDEAQYDKKWAISGKIIFDTTENIFLICTGSSALEMEINADVARRLSKQLIFPNNFKDFLLLKYNIKTDYRFSKALKNLIYFGEKKYAKKSIKLEEKVLGNLYLPSNPPEFEFENFLKSKGIPSTLNLDESESYEKIYTQIDAIINKDIPTVKSFNTSTSETIRKIIFYLGLQKPGGTSINKIANHLSVSPNVVSGILDVLEKTQILFSVKPYGGGGKIVRKPWQYFFLSPSIKAAINFNVGRFNLNNRKCLGTLAETLVANGLYKMIKLDFPFMGLFYPPDKNSSDFIIRTKLDDMVPIEVGVGKKTKKQLKNDINKYDCEFGVLVSNRYNSIRKEEEIIHIPLMTFGFI